MYGYDLLQACSCERSRNFQSQASIKVAGQLVPKVFPPKGHFKGTVLGRGDIKGPAFVLRATLCEPLFPVSICARAHINSLTCANQAVWV